jgi:uncharacterized RmlC-like cupin family protein
MPLLVDAPASLVVVPARQTFEGQRSGKNGAGICTQSVGAQGISMHLLTLPPGGRGRSHVHPHETATYILAGSATTWYGEGLRQQIRSRAGEFLYIPAGIPHVPVNDSETEPAHAVVARTESQEYETAHHRPELDAILDDLNGGTTRP